MSPTRDATSLPNVKHPDLSALAERFARARTRLEETAGSLTEEQLSWRPSVGGWSVGEIIEHLNVTAGLYVPRLQNAATEARAAGRTSDEPIRHRMFGRFFLKAASPGGKQKLKAPKTFHPIEVPATPELFANFDRAQVEFIDCLEKFDGLDLNRVKVKSPALGLIKFGVGTWLSVMAGHQERHLDQIDSRIQDPEFPAA